VSERIVLDDQLLHSQDARRLAERAPALSAAFAKPGVYRRKDKTARIRGPLDLVAAVLDAGRKGTGHPAVQGPGRDEPRTAVGDHAGRGARTLLQVRVDHADDADDMFARLMGDLVEPRREFIQDNALDAEVDV
jgi:DNA gyrase subunit B